MLSTLAMYKCMLTFTTNKIGVESFKACRELEIYLGISARPRRRNYFILIFLKQTGYYMGLSEIIILFKGQLP